MAVPGGAFRRERSHRPRPFLFTSGVRLSRRWGSATRRAHSCASARQPGGDDRCAAATRRLAAYRYGERHVTLQRGGPGVLARRGERHAAESLGLAPLADPNPHELPAFRKHDGGGFRARTAVALRRGRAVSDRLRLARTAPLTRCATGRTRQPSPGTARLEARWPRQPFGLTTANTGASRTFRRASAPNATRAALASREGPASAQPAAPAAPQLHTSSTRSPRMLPTAGPQVGRRSLDPPGRRHAEASAAWRRTRSLRRAGSRPCARARGPARRAGKPRGPAGC